MEVNVGTVIYVTSSVVESEGAVVVDVSRIDVVAVTRDMPELGDTPLTHTVLPLGSTVKMKGNVDELLLGGSTVTIDVTTSVDVEVYDNASGVLLLLSFVGDTSTLEEVLSATAVTVSVTGMKTVLTVVVLHADALVTESKHSTKVYKEPKTSKSRISKTIHVRRGYLGQSSSLTPRT